MRTRSTFIFIFLKLFPLRIIPLSIFHRQKKEEGLSFQIIQMTVNQMEKDVLIWQVFLTILHLAAILSSFFRLYRHKKIAQLWWDDHFAAAALAFDFIFFPGIWLGRMPTQGNVKDIEQNVIVSRIVGSWILTTAFVPLMWCSRTSLALSTARFLPAKTWLHNACIALASLFCAILVGLLVSNIAVCAKPYSTWSKEPPFRCGIEHSLWIAIVFFDLLGDVSLVAIPILAFWNRLKMPPTTRRLIQACFAASSLTAGINIAFIVLLSLAGTYPYHPNKSPSGLLFAQFQPYLSGPASLLVCNLLVVTTSFYRWFRAERKPPAIVSSSTSSNSSSASSASDRRGTSCFASQPMRPDGDDTPGLGFATSSSVPSSGDPDSWNTGSQQPNSSESNSRTSRLELTELFESDLSRP